jgi:hypothetical protein
MVREKGNRKSRSDAGFLSVWRNLFQHHHQAFITELHQRLKKFIAFFIVFCRKQRKHISYLCIHSPFILRCETGCEEYAGEQYKKYSCIKFHLSVSFLE